MMIWKSITIMAMIDILIISGTITAVWQFRRNREILTHLNATRPVLLMISGLFVITTFYLADLVTMFIFPMFMSMSKAMMMMRDLHLNLKWIVSLVGVGLILVGVFILLRNLLPEIMRIQKQLEEKESYLDSILRSSVNMAIAATDLDYKIKYFNPMAEEMFGYSKEDALGQTVQEIHVRENVEPARFDKGIKAVKETGEHNYSIRKGVGDNFKHLESRASGIIDKNQKLIGYVLTSRDTTKNLIIMQSLKDALEEAEAANKAKSSFLATMSHEIRTPMNAILGMAEVLEESDLTDEQREYVQIFENAGKTLLSLLNDILDLSKIEAGQIELESFEFNLDDTIKKVIQVFIGPAREKGLRITYSIAPDVPLNIIGDELRLQQIFFNLVSNAVKFSDQGEIYIHVKNPNRTGEKGLLMFSVSDTGIGVPEDKQKSIFAAFTQADVSTTRKFGGTGLGLSICNKLVGLMCGQLTLKSEYGKGSTFSFTARFGVQENQRLTLLEGSKKTKTSRMRANTRTAVRPLNILVVDDADENLFVMQAFLKTEPHLVDIAKDGQEAFDKMMEVDYDLVFMDMQMPIMDGYTAIQNFRKWEEGKDQEPIIIIALSAFAMKDDIKRVMEVGCDIHLSKPINKQCLLDTISRCS
jgi:two-component system, sensor histidine kinase